MLSIFNNNKIMWISINQSKFKMYNNKIYSNMCKLTTSSKILANNKPTSSQKLDKKEKKSNTILAIRLLNKKFLSLINYKHNK